MLHKGTEQYQAISRTHLEEGSSLWDRSILTDMNQDPLDWIHVYSWNIWTLAPVEIGYVSIQFMFD